MKGKSTELLAAGKSISKSTDAGFCTQKGSLKSCPSSAVSGSRETRSGTVVLPLFCFCFYLLNPVQRTFQLQTLTNAVVKVEMQFCGGWREAVEGSRIGRGDQESSTETFQTLQI